ncbi:hypothetical protein ACF0H5_022718 [Mactra antiquata]
MEEENNKKAKSNQHEKINELLSILPKRGPKTFNIFLEAARKCSQYLADKLTQDYDKEQKRMEKEAKEKEEAANNKEKEGEVFMTTPRSQEKAFEKTFRPKDVTERRHSFSANHAMSSNIIQQNLNTLYTKMKTRVHSNSNNPNKDQTFPTTEPVTFKLIDKQLDELIVSLDENEMTISQCHALLGGRDRNFPLVSHIINIQKSKKQLEQDLKEKDQQKNKYADHISKLENRCRNQTTEITHLNEEIKKMKEEIEKLQVINSEREEKQKIIDELRKMVMDADTTKKSKLRSSYLALHYDSNSSEIKQLRAEVRSLKLENENLKTENLMLKKSDNLKKLAKLREDQAAAKPDIPNGPQGGMDEIKGNNPKNKQLPNAGNASHNIQTRSAFGRRIDIDRGVFVTSSEKPLMKGSLDNIHLHESATDDKSKQTTRLKEHDKQYQNLDFKFNSQNGSLGQKRVPSKDRSNKRVTFYTDAGDQNDNKDNVVRIPTADNDNTDDVDKTKASANGNSEQSGNGSGKGSTGTKSDRSRGRFKQNHLKAKAANKRSASLNSVTTTSRDIMKMSSHLIQKSRNLRHPTSN